MKEIRKAADATRMDLLGDGPSLCQAANVVILFLLNLREEASGWRFWLRAALSLVIGLLQTLVDQECTDGTG